MCPQIETMLRDALYSSRKICSTVDGYGITPYFLPKTNATFRAKGVPSWKTMLYGFIANTQYWMEQYHMRSISESEPLKRESITFLLVIPWILHFLMWMFISTLPDSVLIVLWYV